MGIFKPVHDFYEDEWLHACIKAYAFGDRFVVPKFCRAINNFFTDTLGYCYYSCPAGRRSTSYAFRNIPSDRIILQRLVDKYCASYAADAIGYGLEGMGDLPVAFLRRVIHRFQELSKMSAREKAKARCYLEHTSDEEKGECSDLHMRYDEKTDLAYFE